MANIEAIIFDWAGTTVDYGSFAPVRAFQEVFRQYGLEPTMEETRMPMGMLKIDHIRTMLNMPRLAAEWKRVHGRLFTERDVKAMHDIFASKLMTILHEFATPKPYVLDTVAQLRAKGYKIGSTTGYTDAMMSIVVPEAAKRGYAPDCWFSPDSTNVISPRYHRSVFYFPFIADSSYFSFQENIPKNYICQPLHLRNLQQLAFNQSISRSAVNS